MNRRPLLFLPLFVLAFVSFHCSPTMTAAAATAPSATLSPPQILHPEKLEQMDEAINEAITNRHCPGGVLWFEHRGALYRKAYGNRALVPSVESMTEDTIFDAASLTKVIACTPAVMLLVERGQIDLDAHV